MKEPKHSETDTALGVRCNGGWTAPLGRVLKVRFVAPCNSAPLCGKTDFLMKTRQQVQAKWINTCVKTNLLNVQRGQSRKLHSKHLRNCRGFGRDPTSNVVQNCDNIRATTGCRKRGDIKLANSLSVQFHPIKLVCILG